MNKINNTSVVKQQYANANNLNTRISIHDKYSTNKMGFGNWIMSNYRIDEKMKVLELGCGTMVETVWKLAKEKIDAGYKVGIICTDESRSHYPEGEVRSIGARKSQASVAHNLYALLREFDDLKVDYIYSESFSQDHLGQAIMNRLSKAAGYQIYKV